MITDVLLHKLIIAINKLNEDDIAEWITVKGHHIPVLKGQTKKNAIQSFIEEKETGGYSDKNKSNRSIAAEVSGKDNATNLAKALGISSKDVKYLYSDEWHHTNKNFAKTKYYFTQAYLDLQKHGKISTDTIDKYDLNEYQIKGITNSWQDYLKIKDNSDTPDSLAQSWKNKYKNPKIHEAIDAALSNKKKTGSILADEIRWNIKDILKGDKDAIEHLDKSFEFYENIYNKKALNQIDKSGYIVESDLLNPDKRNNIRYQDVLLNKQYNTEIDTKSQGDTQMKITAQNAIFLGEETGGKGRQFKARFLVPGLVKYDYGVCLLTKENADKFIQGFTGCPVVINHQDVTDENVKEVGAGDIFSVWFDEKDGYYWCNGIIRDKKAIELINQGYSVSCQYVITEYSDNTEGKLHNGNPYDKVIENGRPEHLAIVNNPRYEGAIIAVNALNTTLSNSIEDIKIAANDIPALISDTIADTLAEGIIESLKAINGWVTLDRIDEETGERVRIFIGGDEAASYHSKWFDDDIDEFKKSKETKIKLDSLHKDVKNTILNTVNDINKQFKIKDLVSVSTGPLQRAYAFNLTDMEHNAIRVSKKKFEDLEKLKTSFNKDCDVLFHPKGLKDVDPVKAIIMHELGHSITVAGGTSEFWNEIETIRTKHNKALGVSSYKTFKKKKGNYNTENMISSYALYNQYEFVAEGFVDAMLSKNPCKYSKDVLKCIEKHFEITGQKQKQLRLFNAIMEAVNAMSNEKKKNEEPTKDNLFLENFGLGYPSQEEFDTWIEEQENEN